MATREIRPKTSSRLVPKVGPAAARVAAQSRMQNDVRTVRNW
jgi:hypothetical protein